MPDYYAILGVSQNATAAEIKRAYRKLAVAYHPDKNPDPKVAERFKEITEAYNTLGDEESRRVYDLRFSTAFKEAFEQQTQPGHRDPRYQNKRPSQRHSQSDKWTMQELIAVGIVYTRYCCYAGLVIIFLLALDYVLPYREVQDQVTEIHPVKYKRSVAFIRVTTQQGKSFKVYSWREYPITEGDTIVLSCSPILSLPIKATKTKDISSADPNAQLRMGYLYRSLIFFPIILLGFSLMGLTKFFSAETNFNFGIGAGLLVLVLLYFILTS